MAYELKELSNKHRAVARYLALGASLQDVCAQLNLNIQTWRQITTSPIFQHELERITTELEDKLLEQAVQDPVLAKLRLATNKAAERLIIEVDGLGDDSNASTRIKAAESILDRCGYKFKEETQQNNVIFVSLSPTKLDAIMSKKELAEQPASVQG